MKIFAIFIVVVLSTFCGAYFEAKEVITEPSSWALFGYFWGLIVGLIISE